MGLFAPFLFYYFKIVYIIKLIKFGVKKMKAIYLLALFAVSSHAHEGNAIFHYHVSDYLILAVVTVVTFGVVKILKRRDV